jgi:hypothetical protein
MPKELKTIGELLHWSYANLAMAHAAIEDGDEKYGRKHWIIRSRLYSGLRKGTMNLGSLADDERLKMILPQACCYCGSDEHLAIDHLMPRAKGGADTGDNLVWACRSCNSSKGTKDVFEWLSSRGQTPPLLLARRFLKLAIGIATKQGVMNVPLGEDASLPYSQSSVPTSFPAGGCVLWVRPVHSRG